MPQTRQGLSEEDIKTEITNLYFPKSLYTIEKNRLDFSVLSKTGEYLYWAESKKGTYDKWTMLAQLFLTIKPRIDNAEMPPPFIGCFDENDITFLEFHHAQEVFATNDFDWTQRPSSVSPKTASKVKQILDGKEMTFCWQIDKEAIKEFIKNNFIAKDLFTHSGLAGFLQITKNNFVQIFDRWSRDVLPSISIPPDILKSGIMPRDFYLADLLSINNKTISQKLKILLNGDNYEVQLINDMFNKIHFKDKGTSHKKFWNAYERPPKKEYQKYMLERQDLLVESGIRERKGAFFTPQIWVEKSQEYLAQVFGEDWQDEYYIWDCCAGTGNLENGLSNKENIWVSTLDDSDVRVMKDNQRLLQNHIFQFDFLNDSFDKLPKKLQEIINDPEKQKKLIIYINPPYAEAANKDETSKAGVANKTIVFDKFKHFVGSEALNELFAQFFIRVNYELPNSILASFSTPKYITSDKFNKFRECFRAEFKAGFICNASSFDNVKGQFPISFTIWKLDNKYPIIKQITTDVCWLDAENKNCYVKGTKNFYTISNTSIADWRKTFYSYISSQIGFIIIVGPSMQSNNNTFITNHPAESYIKKGMVANIDNINLIPMSIYFSVRWSIPADWLNNRDQFLYPNDGWQNDTEFQNDCLIFTLFHSQNRIMSTDGTNHWIPFTASQVNARDSFESSFMADFIKGRAFSPEAQNVLNCARDLWTYYQSEDNNELNINASLYEIREYYRGRTDNGRLRSKSSDEKFQELDTALKSALSALAPKIAEKVYEYGFLMK